MAAIKQPHTNEDHLKYIKSISPISWIHINMTGKYEFTGNRGSIDIDKFVKQLKPGLSDEISLKARNNEVYGGY